MLLCNESLKAYIPRGQISDGYPCVAELWVIFFTVILYAFQVFWTSMYDFCISIKK